MSKRDIFVSRPSTRNDQQEAFLEHLDGLLEKRDLRPVAVGQTEYPIRPSTPFKTVWKRAKALSFWDWSSCTS